MTKSAWASTRRTGTSCFRPTSLIQPAPSSESAARIRNHCLKVLADAAEDRRHTTDGFALIAYPTTYGDTGIMTFIVNQITRYDPDDGWQVSKRQRQKA